MVSGLSKAHLNCRTGSCHSVRWGRILLWSSAGHRRETRSGDGHGGRGAGQMIWLLSPVDFVYGSSKGYISLNLKANYYMWISWVNINSPLTGKSWMITWICMENKYLKTGYLFKTPEWLNNFPTKSIQCLSPAQRFPISLQNLDHMFRKMVWSCCFHCGKIYFSPQTSPSAYVLSIGSLHLSWMNLLYNSPEYRLLYTYSPSPINQSIWSLATALRASASS